MAWTFSAMHVHGILKFVENEEADRLAREGAQHSFSRLRGVTEVLRRRQAKAFVVDIRPHRMDGCSRQVDSFPAGTVVSRKHLDENCLSVSESKCL